jgi:hypothetical protein
MHHSASPWTVHSGNLIRWLEEFDAEFVRKLKAKVKTFFTAKPEMGEDVVVMNFRASISGLLDISDVMKLHARVSAEVREKPPSPNQIECIELLGDFILDEGSYREIVDDNERRDEELKLMSIQKDLGMTGVLQAITDFARMRGQEGSLTAGSLTAAVVLSHLRDNPNQALADVLREMITVSNAALSAQCAAP